MKYAVWVWVTAAPELERGQFALKVSGLGNATIEQQRDLAAYIERMLNGYKPTKENDRDAA